MTIIVAVTYALHLIAFPSGLSAPSPQAAPVDPASTPSPRELFRKTFARLETYPIPPYTLIVSLWRVRPVSRPDREFDQISRYAIRYPDGTENASIVKTFKSLPVATVGSESVGLFATVLRPPPLVSMRQTPDDSGLKTIAVVAATYGDYRMELVGEDRIDGHVTEHVHLTPLRDLPKYNLRDLWIDAQTFDLRRAKFVFLGRPDDPLRNGATIAVDFGPAGRYWIVRHSKWFTVREDFDLTTLRVLTPAALPNWLFDQSEYDRHRRAGDVDPLEEILSPTPSPTVSPSGS
jgi:hypothetical protein